MNLVSGATGLVGCHLLAKLILEKSACRAMYRTEIKKNHAIKVIQKYGISETEIAQYVDWQKADILRIPDLEVAFQNIKYVYHCAGFISNSPADYKKMRKVNIEGTANMVNTALAFGIKKFCHVSSIATLGQPLADEAITEETPNNLENKQSAYSISKYGAEIEIWRASQEGLDVVIVNPGIILGDGFLSSGSGKIIEKASTGFKFYPQKTTGFVSVYELADAMILLMKSDTKRERFILVSENLSFKTLMREIAIQFDSEPPKVALKPWMLYLAWLMEILKSSFSSHRRQLTRRSISSFFKTNYYDASKIENAIGFKFQNISKSVEEIAKRERG
ncbi:MAG: NAD-dependent epimerase/dehydratase family protein [Psychroflexus sp.]